MKQCMIFTFYALALLLCACGGNGNSDQQVDNFLGEEPVIENPHMPSDEAKRFKEVENRLADMDVQLRSYQYHEFLLQLRRKEGRGCSRSCCPGLKIF